MASLIIHSNNRFFRATPLKTELSLKAANQSGVHRIFHSSFTIHTTHSLTRIRFTKLSIPSTLRRITSRFVFRSFPVCLLYHLYFAQLVFNPKRPVLFQQRTSITSFFLKENIPIAFFIVLISRIYCSCYQRDLLSPKKVSYKHLTTRSCW